VVRDEAADERDERPLRCAPARLAGEAGVLRDLLGDQLERDVGHARQGLERLRLVAPVRGPDHLVDLLRREVLDGELDHDAVDQLLLVRGPQPRGRPIGVLGGPAFLRALGAAVDVLDPYFALFMQVEQQDPANAAPQTGVRLEVSLEMASRFRRVVRSVRCIGHVAMILRDS
jgi:hypothetical protein